MLSDDRAVLRELNQNSVRQSKNVSFSTEGLPPKYQSQTIDMSGRDPKKAVEDLDKELRELREKRERDI